MNIFAPTKSDSHPALIPGALGWFNEWGGELLNNTPKTVRNEGALVTDAIGDLFKQDILTAPEEKHSDRQKTEIGGKTELRFDEKEQAYQEKARIAKFQRELTQAEREAMEKEARRKSIAKQRETVIRTVGGITNLAYEDVMDNQGNMRIDIEAWFNNKNSEMQEAELKKQKQTQVKQATGKINYFMQHNMAGERSGGQHVLSAVG